jgi:NADPH:quinone reductase-like Zn-dependent oxidoreductase
MRVMQIEGEWGLDHIKLAERPDPEPGPGEVVLRMKAASLNYRDTVMVNRGYGRRSGELPLVPVGDGAGEVIAVGDGVTGFAAGDLAIPAFSQTWIAGPFTERSWNGTLGGPLDGTMQEMMCLRAEGLVKAPAHMSAAEAASLPCAAMTAWNALVGQGHMQAGDVVVIQGTGGVSLFGLQIAKMMGGEVILTSSSDEKLEKGKAMGADHLINYREVEEWGRKVLEITGGRGADHVVEVGGAGTLAQSIRAIRPSGTVSLIGVLSGAGGEINLGPVVTQNVSLQGITVGSRDMLADMCRAFELHELRPAIDKSRGFAFEDVAQALREFPEGRHFGKVVCEF